MLGNFAAAASSSDAGKLFQPPTASTSKKSPYYGLLNWYSNMFAVTTFVYATWILLGLLFYYFVDGWTWATAFFFALQAGLSVGFCAPVEHTNASRLFTVFYILLGSSVVAGSLGRFAGQLLYSKVHIAGRKKFRNMQEYLGYEVDHPDIFEWASYAWYRWKRSIGWYTHRSRVVLTVSLLLWFSLGVTYGMVMENWGFVVSLHFAVSCLSTAGLQTPTCDGDPESCSLTPGRGVFLGFYILVGVPLYAVTLGQFAGIAVEHAALEKNKERMKQPIEARDFHFAATLLSEEKSTTLELGEFIILELMRLGVADRALIKQISARFSDLDIKQNNVLDFEELRLGGYVIEGKLHKRFTKIPTFKRRTDSGEPSVTKVISVKSESNLSSLIANATGIESQTAASRVQSDGDIPSFEQSRTRRLSLTSTKEDDAAPSSPSRGTMPYIRLDIPKLESNYDFGAMFEPNPAPKLSMQSDDCGVCSSWLPTTGTYSSPRVPRKPSISTDIYLPNPSIIISNGMEIPILPPQLRPKEPKAYENHEDLSDSSSDSDGENTDRGRVSRRKSDAEGLKRTRSNWMNTLRKSASPRLSRQPETEMVPTRPTSKTIGGNMLGVAQGAEAEAYLPRNDSAQLGRGNSVRNSRTFRSFSG